MGKNKVETVDEVAETGAMAGAAGAVKKAFQPIVAFLEANKDKTVSEILGDVIALTAAKGSRVASASLKDADGKTWAVRCYWHEQWELVDGEGAVEYGPKANTSTGLNSMCRSGTNQWNAANNGKKKQKEQIFQDLMAQKITHEEAQAQTAELNKPVEKVMDVPGYATKEEAVAALAAMGITVTG